MASLSGFSGNGGVCVASCHFSKCDAMRMAVHKRGHMSCVLFKPGQDTAFAMEFGGNVQKFARDALHVVVIVGDHYEEGQTQQHEMNELRRVGIPFQKMTLGKYEQTWPLEPVACAPPAACWVVQHVRQPVVQVIAQVIPLVVFVLCNGEQKANIDRELDLFENMVSKASSSDPAFLNDILSLWGSLVRRYQFDWEQINRLNRIIEELRRRINFGADQTEKQRASHVSGVPMSQQNIDPLVLQQRVNGLREKLQAQTTFLNGKGFEL